MRRRQPRRVVSGTRRDFGSCRRWDFADRRPILSCRGGGGCIVYPDPYDDDVHAQRQRGCCARAQSPRDHCCMPDAIACVSAAAYLHVQTQTGMTRLGSKYIPLIATALVLIALYAVGCLVYRNFFSL